MIYIVVGLKNEMEGAQKIQRMLLPNLSLSQCQYALPRQIGVYKKITGLKNV